MQNKKWMKMKSLLISIYNQDFSLQELLMEMNSWQRCVTNRDESYCGKWFLDHKPQGAKNESLLYSALSKPCWILISVQLTADARSDFLSSMTHSALYHWRCNYRAALPNELCFLFHLTQYADGTFSRVWAYSGGLAIPAWKTELSADCALIASLSWQQLFCQCVLWSNWSPWQINETPKKVQPELVNYFNCSDVLWLGCQLCIASEICGPK